MNTMQELRQQLRMVVLGDSIAEGLGVKGCCYADLLQKRLVELGRQVTLLNLAYTAFQITDSRKLWPEVISFGPDIVVLAHGITEAIVRPKPSALRLVPLQWHRIGGLDPRPYYSRRVWKRLVQQLESAVRWRVQVQLIRRSGGETLMAPENFECELTKCLDALLNRTSAQVILLTHSGIDKRFYPDSLESLQRFQQSITRAALQAAVPNRVQVSDVSCQLDQWTDFFADHFHPNALGHAKIAAALGEKVAL
jgi:lysophospholipase L1-like esterase